MLILCVMNISLNVYTSFVVSKDLQTLLQVNKAARGKTMSSNVCIQNPDDYADFTSLGYLGTMFKSAVAICVFFSWVKLFKYISFNKTMTQLASTLGRSVSLPRDKSSHLSSSS